MGNNPPRNEFRFNAGINQPCEPRQRRVTVRAAQGLAERAEHVIIQTFVTANHGLLDGFLRNGKGDVDNALCVGGCRKHSKLHRTERRAGIAARDSRDMAQRIVIGDDMHLPIASLRVVDGAAHSSQHVRSVSGSNWNTRQRLTIAGVMDTIGFSVVEPIKRMIPAQWRAGCCRSAALTSGDIHPAADKWTARRRGAPARRQ